VNTINYNRQNKLGLVMAGLLLGILISAMDNTIVATAMGTIVGDLGGLDKFVWVTSAYMVAEMAGMPIFGKLSDMYGRKRFFVFGLILFLIGSILCGTAESIVQLSIYRAIQGIGGGAIMPIAFTIVYDIFPVEKRGKMSGLFGAVFGTSSLFGPLLGAYITDYINWRWVFYINLPLGILSLIFILAFYKESVEHAKQKIDWLGAFTLVAAVVCLMFGLELGGAVYDWGSSVILALVAGFAICFSAFLYIETKAEEPIISFRMFKLRLFAASNAAALCYGAAFIATTIYIPIYVQGVMGGTATNSGLLLLPLTLGSVVTAQIGGFLSTKMSYRNIMLASAVIFALGIFLLSTLTPASSRLSITLFMVVVGFGLGFSFSVLGMSSMHHFEANQRGSASATSSFIRAFGMTLGITIFGIIQRNNFTHFLQATFNGSGTSSLEAISQDTRALLSPEFRANVEPALLQKITAALSSSIAQTFIWVMVPALLAFVSVCLMGKERMMLAENNGSFTKNTSRSVGKIL
jgi:EmrB/QacA subfamily drug resistance transporter